MTRHDVLAALAEYDRLGEQDFLDRYGFGQARRYELVHQRKWCASKAVLGVAVASPS